MPFPRPEATPPVTNTYLGRGITTGFHGNRGGRRSEPLFSRRGRRFRWEVALPQPPQVVEPPERRCGPDQAGQRDRLGHHVEEHYQAEPDDPPQGREPEEESR